MPLKVLCLLSQNYIKKSPTLSFGKHSYHQFFVQSLDTVKGLMPSVAGAEIQLGLQCGSVHTRSDG